LLDSCCQPSDEPKCHADLTDSPWATAPVPVADKLVVAVVFAVAFAVVFAVAPGFVSGFQLQYKQKQYHVVEFLLAHVRTVQPAALTDIFSGFPQTLHANAGEGHGRSLPNSFQFIIHCLPPIRRCSDNQLRTYHICQLSIFIPNCVLSCITKTL
jgi:hypothetical protein